MNGRRGSISGQEVVVPNVGEGQYGQAYADLFAAYYQGLVFSGGSNPVSSLKSSSANPAASGIVRLARADELHFGASDWALGVDSSNRQTWRGTQHTYQPTVLATSTSAQVPNGVTTVVIWNSASVNSGTMLNTSTGVVTIPLAGLYWIHAQLMIAAAAPTNSTTQLAMRINASQFRRGRLADSAAGKIAFPQVQTIGLFRLAVNDTVDFQVDHTGAAEAVSSDPRFTQLCIRRVSA